MPHKLCIYIYRRLEGAAVVETGLLVVDQGKALNEQR